MKHSLPGSSDYEAAVKVVREAGKKWPSTIVARTQVPQFTGGAYSDRTMANRDSDGDGPSGAFKIGRNVVYPVDSLCDWLISRIEAEDISSVTFAAREAKSQNRSR